MKRKLVTLLLALCSIFSFGAFPACDDDTQSEAKSSSEYSSSSENDTQSDSKEASSDEGEKPSEPTVGLEYVLCGDEKCYIVAGIGTATETDIVIPIIHNELPVTKIDDGAFLECSQITSVVIPDSITYLGAAAFYGCTNIKSVTLGNGITSILPQVFMGCNNLTSIVIPDSVNRMSLSAFLECTSLKTVTIGKNVQFEIPLSDPFRDSIHLENITVAEGNPHLKSIDGHLYVYNTDGHWMLIQYALGKTDTEYNVPDDVAILGAILRDCDRLTNIKVKEGHKYHWSLDGNLCSGTSLIKYANGKTDEELIIPDGATSIESYAFYGCRNLKRVVIPNSLKRINGYAFQECGITTVYYAGNETQFSGITVETNNEIWNAVKVYYYSETKPLAENAYWHYVNGVPTVW